MKTKEYGHHLPHPLLPSPQVGGSVPPLAEPPGMPAVPQVTQPGKPSHSAEPCLPPTRIIARAGEEHRPGGQAGSGSNISKYIVYLFVFLKTRPSFIAVLGSQRNGAEGTEIFPYIPCPPTADTHVASPTINTQHQSGASVTTDEPALKCQYHPKSIVYNRVHSCVLPSIGLGK